MGHRIVRSLSAKLLYVRPKSGTSPLVDLSEATRPHDSLSGSGTSNAASQCCSRTTWSRPSRWALTNLFAVLPLILVLSCTPPQSPQPPFNPTPPTAYIPSLPPPIASVYAPLPGPRAGPSLRYKQTRCAAGRRWIKARWVNKRKVPGHCA